MVQRSARVLMSAAVCVAIAGCAHGPRGQTDQEHSWRETFGVDPGTLSTLGSNTCLPLRPGIAWTYRDGATTLVVRVLDQPKVVDGVGTLVVEEREEAGGMLKELSHNYFAIEPRSGDVYYFGENVDIYSNQQLVTHEGAWRSGADGARFGLFLPGTPVVGDRFYQEMAPGVAMDRVEIVSVDERVETPAGVFDRCVHLRESTPLEGGTGHKWFAPGVGLVKDGSMVLVSYTGTGAAR